MDRVHVEGTIRADSLVEEVVQRYPHTLPVLARHGMHCAGCYISPFHTIGDVAREYALALGPLLADLNRAAVA